MVKSSRRQAVGAIIGAGAMMCVAPGARAFGSAGVRIPQGPMKLGRIVARELRDGAQLTVARQWEVTFRQQGRGFAIAGQQADVSVEAPAVLAPLAEIEKARSTQGMFPIMLDNAGMIFAAGDSVADNDLDAAIREAEQTIVQTSTSASMERERLAFLARLQHAGGAMLEQMPRDLFFPQGDAVREVQPLTLTSGGEGQFEYTYTATASNSGPWLSRAERRVITRIGDDQRLSSEVWTLD